MKAIGTITIILNIILPHPDLDLIRNLLFWIGLVKEHLEMSLRFDNVAHFHNFQLILVLYSHILCEEIVF